MILRRSVPVSFRAYRRRGLFFAALLLASTLSASQTYTYTGQNFSSVTPPYTTSERVSGSFTVAVALPHFMPMTDIAGSLVSYSFSDGVQTRSNANSFTCDFRVATDGAGQISAWSVYLTQAPHPAVGDPEQTLTMASVSFDVVGSGAAVASACDGISQPIFAATTGPGSWSAALPPGAPTTYHYTGQTFATVSGPYTTSEKVTGSVLLANPLPSFMPLTDVSDAVSDFSFSDGVQTRTPANTHVCQLEVGTDGAGNIVQWAIFLREAPQPAAGDPQLSMSLFGASRDDVGSGPAVADPCGVILQTFFAESSGPGTWNAGIAPHPTTYTYAGHPFTSADSPYTTADRVTGSITLAGPLPPFLPMTDISAALTAFSFTDGVQTRTPASSTICSFRVATDGTGAIARWVVELRQAPAPSPGDPQQDLESTWSIGDIVGTGPAAATACGVILLSPTASTSSIGSWSGPHLPATPTRYDYAGPFFTGFLAPYSAALHVTGFLRFADPLPPNMPLTDVTAAVDDFSYSDGIQTRTPADSVVCSLEVATDAAGRIVEWKIELRERVASFSDPFQSIDSIHVGTVEVDVGGTNPSGGNPCGAFSLDPFGSTVGSGRVGTWTFPAVSGAAGIPTLSIPGLLLLGLLVGAGGVAALHARR